MGLVYVPERDTLLTLLGDTDERPTEVEDGFEWGTEDLARFTVVVVRMQQLGYTMSRHPHEVILSQKRDKPAPVEVATSVSAWVSALLKWTLGHPLGYLVAWTHSREETRAFGVAYLLQQVAMDKNAFVVCGHQSVHAWHRAWRGLTGRHTCDVRVLTPGEVSSKLRCDRDSACVVDYDSYSARFSWYEKIVPPPGIFGATVIVSHMSHQSQDPTRQFIEQICNAYPDTEGGFLKALPKWEMDVLKRRLLSCPTTPTTTQPAVVPVPVTLTPQQRRDAGKLHRAIGEAATKKKTDARRRALETFASRCVISNARDAILDSITPDGSALVATPQVSKWAEHRGIRNSVSDWERAQVEFKKQHPDTWGHVFADNSVWYIKLTL